MGEHASGESTSSTAGAPDARPFLILVSSFARSSREYFLTSLASRYRVWLFLGGPGRASELTWEQPYLVGHTALDTLDAAAMTAEAQRLDHVLRSSGDRVAGVICYDESRIVATAAVAEALGLPTSPVEAIERCRDKHLSRQALEAAGVPQAASVAVRSVEEAASAAARLGYPVVLKPRNLAASFGVSKADSAEELTAAYARARSVTLPETPEQYEDDVLIEEYLDGPEISVDSACFDGQVVPLAVAHKECGFAPAFEEVGHLVDGADPLLRDDGPLHDLLTRAHRAVGFTTGMTHVELRRTADGFKVIEVNARLGGDLIPYLGQLATGVDLSLVAAAIACGQAPDLTPSASRVAAVRFYYPEHDLIVESIDIDPDLLPPGAAQVAVLAAPGQHLKLPPRRTAWECRVAQALTVADDEAGCRSVLDAVAKAITVRPAR